MVGVQSTIAVWQTDKDTWHVESVQTRNPRRGGDTWLIDKRAR